MSYDINPSTTASTGATGATDAKAILDSINAAIAKVQLVSDEPFAAFMRDRGFDPAKGCVMVVPKGTFGTVILPYFVKENPLATAVLLLNPASMMGGLP